MIVKKGKKFMKRESFNSEIKMGKIFKKIKMIYGGNL